MFRKKTVDAAKLIEFEFFPKRSNDVKEVPRITLVVMDMENLAEERGTLALMESIVRECGTSGQGRTLKSALVFAAANPGENVNDRAREALAWEDVDEDSETKDRIDEGQLKLLQRNLKNAQRDLDESIFRAYQHLYMLGKDNKLRHIPLGNITSSSAGSLIEIYLQRLGSNGLDEIVDSVPARKLASFWPASQAEWSTKAVRDAFYSSPLLPRLLNPDAIKRTIADGVTQGLIGYAVKDARGQLKLEKLKESLFDKDVEISPDVFILKAEDAQKLREPPRLAQITIRPEQVSLKIHDQASFVCAGIDQYGQPIPVGKIAWSTSTGVLNESGLLTVGDHSGKFIVKAAEGAIEALAEVTVTASSISDPDPIVPVIAGDRTLHWHGAVPSQKWMNFYMKVLSRFASMPGLKLEVTFDVSVAPEQAASKSDEAKAGLRELGLTDDVRIR